MKPTNPKFKIGDRVKYATSSKVGTIKRITRLPFSSEPCYEVEGFEIVSNGMTLPSLEAESLLIAAE
jgi:hypothetical protein